MTKKHDNDGRRPLERVVRARTKAAVEAALTRLMKHEHVTRREAEAMLLLDLMSETRKKTTIMNEMHRKLIAANVEIGRLQ